MVQNPCRMKSSNSSSVAPSMTSLFCWRKYFSFEKTSSAGYKSGEYGGRKWTNAPVPSIAARTWLQWWNLTLSISTTLLGFLPSKGISFVTRFLSIKSQKMSALTLPFVVKTSTIPLKSIAQIEENLFPLTNNWVSTAGFPTSNNIIIKRRVELEASQQACSETTY